MKKLINFKDDNLYVELAEIIRIANSAVKKAKEENLKFGIPDTFWKGGRVYYVLENGDITTEAPDIMKRKTA